MITQIGYSEERVGEPHIIFFRHESASACVCVLDDVPSVAYLMDVYATQPRKGHASAMLKEIDEYCKTNNLLLIVEAIWHEGEEGAITDGATLRAFYEKAGATYKEEGAYGSILHMGNL